MSGTVRVIGVFQVGGNTDLDAQTDRVMEELLEIEETVGMITDPSVSASLRDRIVEIEVTVSAHTEADAVIVAQQAIKQAVEAAGSTTDVDSPSSGAAQFRKSRELVAAR